MCSIHGWYAWGNARPNLELLQGMLRLGAERGGTAPNYSNDATGIAYMGDDNQILVMKAGIKAKSFIESVKAEDWARIAASPRGLMHNRARTKGTIVQASNHPISAYGWVAVHNGTISNDDDLFAHFKEERPADVDSVAIPLVLKQGKDYMDSLRQLSTLSGGVTTAVWKVEQTDTIAVGRWGPNDLYMWYDDQAKIVYWSSAYMTSLYMPYKSMGSLRFQSMTRFPEDRILVLTPEGARTYQLKRRPFLLPLEQLNMYRRSSSGTPLPKHTDTNGTSTTSDTNDTPTESGFSGRTPMKTRSRIPFHDEPSEGWKWIPVESLANKPPPVAENIITTYYSRDLISEELLNKVGPASKEIPVGYGTWHISCTTMDNGEKRLFRFFKFAKRMRPWVESYFGRLPLLPEIRNILNEHDLDNRLALERFIITRKVGTGYTELAGYMCPLCGITQNKYTWSYWGARCRWCDVQYIMPPETGV